MSARLIRALQSGGMASKLERDLWGIWRGRDRRRRMIGTLTGADVDVLRARECLSQVGEEDPTILIWTGQAEEPCALTPSARALKTAPRGSDPMLLRLLADCHDPKLRGLYRQLAAAYRKDTELAEQRERSPGMNWGTISLGTRVGGGRVSREALPSPDAAKARSRLAKLRHHLTAQEVDFLDALIVREETRASLAKRYGMPPPSVASRARYLLRSLRDLYPIKGGY